MTNITKILTRTNCASNHAATGVYQASVLSDRYRVRVDPIDDWWCVIDRVVLSYIFAFNEVSRQPCWVDAIVCNKLWQSFDDALAFAKLLDKAV